MLAWEYCIAYQYSWYLLVYPYDPIWMCHMHRLNLLPELLKKWNWCKVVVAVNVVVTTCNISGQPFHHFSPKLVSGWSFSLPMYTLSSHMIPFLASARTHALIPRFTGFSGTYCLSEERPLNLIVASSMEFSQLGLYVSKAVFTASMIGRIFPSLSYHGSPCCANELLSTRCRYHLISSNRFCEMRDAIGK